jgi:hypothetical protein
MLLVLVRLLPMDPSFISMGTLAREARLQCAEGRQYTHLAPGGWLASTGCLGIRAPWSSFYRH